MKALINDEGELVGFSENSADGIEVPDDCDLEPGKYIWDGKSFNPIMSKFKENGPAPDFFRAVLKSLASIRNSGVVKFTPDVLSWLSSEEKSLKSLGKW